MIIKAGILISIVILFVGVPKLLKSIIDDYLLEKRLQKIQANYEQK
jgi:hypothetical protein